MSIQTNKRRGSILVVVLALLALFAVVGLAFALYAESNANSSRNNRHSRSIDSPPDPTDTAKLFINQALFDTNDPTSAMYTWSLGVSKYGGTPIVSATNSGSNVTITTAQPHGLTAGVPVIIQGMAPSVYNGTFVVSSSSSKTGFVVNLPTTPSGPPTSLGLISNQYVPFAGTGIPNENVSGINRRQAVNFNGTGIQPFIGNNGPFSRAVNWTYPDSNNFFLAWMDPTTGAITVPSFHRSDVFGTLAPSNPNWASAQGKYMTLRPRTQEHPNFPKIMPDLDGTYRGDVANMKFITGVQKNDSLWMHLGSPVVTWRGKSYTTMVAPIILDLSSRVNLSIAANSKNGGAHGSQHGLGPWEINPRKLNTGVFTNAEQNAIITARQGNGNVPAEPNTGTLFANINQGHVSAPYALINVDAASATSPMTLPTANLPFPTYPPAGFESTQANFTNALQRHPSLFNPFQRPRGTSTAVTATTPHAFGMDQLVHELARYSDPKTRYSTDQLYTSATNAMNNTNIRHRTTPFSVSQQWGSIKIRTGATSADVATLGPIDLNRPLASFRPNTAAPYSSTNIHAIGSAPYTDAVKSRQNLARDIFIRLAAAASDPVNGTGLIDGTNVVYITNTGYLSFTGVPSAGIRQCAQLAANIVDYIDDDDIMTQFVYNPMNPAVDPNQDVTNFSVTELPNRVVYGTELPRLVVNEAYSLIENDQVNDNPPPVVTMNNMNKMPAKYQMQRKFWVELTNPLPTDNGTLSDAGAARLRDTTAAAPFSIYQLQIAESNVATSYTDYLKLNEANCAIDPATAPGLSVKLTTDKFTASTASTILTGGQENLVLPANGANGTDGSNQGYFVVGVEDMKNKAKSHPSNSVTNSLTQANATPQMVGGGGGAVGTDAMGYNAGDPDMQTIATAKTKNCTVILRRLVNPYVKDNATPGANYNPYITVDYMEKILSENQVKYDTTDVINPAPQAPAMASTGKLHPYASTGTQPQAGNGTPANTFFKSNTGAGNTWLTHLDRELINSTEAMNVSIYSPGMLTNKFWNGTNYNMHTRVTNTPSNRGAFDDSIFPTGAVFSTGPVQNMSKVLDLITVGNRLPQVPLGGRNPGVINLNGAYDSTTLTAVSDHQNSNNFSLATESTMWSTFVLKRTPTVTPTGMGDNPFPESMLPSLDFLYDTTAAHPYVAQEPLRKILNSTSTTGDGFLLIYTVGFFEVDVNTAISNPTFTNGGYKFGKEMSDKVPGDLRAQYAAVVDRSMLGVTQGSTLFSTTTQVQQPWETKLTADAAIGATTLTVQGTNTGIRQPEGSTVTYANLAGTYVRVGLGDANTNAADGEWVRVSNAVYAGTGKATLTVVSTTRFHGAGTRVGAILPSNPGPQPTIDVTDNTKYRHIVPYFTRLWN